MHAHLRELEEADHRRGEEVGRLAGAGADEIDDQAFLAERVEARRQIGGADAEARGDLVEARGQDRQARGERGFLGRDEQFEDLLPGELRLLGPRLGQADRARLEAMQERAVLVLDAAEVAHQPAHLAVAHHHEAWGAVSSRRPMGP